MPIEVKLIDTKVLPPLQMISHAALTCYQPQIPEMGKVIDIEKRLWKVGHHTTFQHSTFTFDIENIAVSDVTFGLHLCHPFYNTSQRSGRYCSNMFEKPDWNNIEGYITQYWPNLSKKAVKAVISYIKSGIRIYQKNIASATKKTAELLKEERPMASEKYVNANAPKIAQEQMRAFITTLFPTALTYTVSLSGLAAMWESAYTPQLRGVTDGMVVEVLKVQPELKFIFDPARRRGFDSSIPDWSVPFASRRSGIMIEPSVTLLDVSGPVAYNPDASLKHPVDRLQFTPEYMGNNVRGIRSSVAISVATFGQDQRHRSIARTSPTFTNNFYLPPVPREIGLFDAALKFQQQWAALCDDLPGTLATAIAPYGAMVTYEKNGSFNAESHEYVKRLCICSQQEIYEVARKLRLAVIKKKKHVKSVLPIFDPPCRKTGKCGEGDRFCGRDLRLRTKEEFFVRRKV